MPAPTRPSPSKIRRNLPLTSSAGFSNCVVLRSTADRKRVTPSCPPFRRSPSPLPPRPVVETNRHAACRTSRWYWPATGPNRLSRMCVSSIKSARICMRKFCCACSVGKKEPPARSKADSQPWGAGFRDTLPLAGTDGSLYDRFKALDVQGRVRAKTGSLGGVKALSGYATTNRGEAVAFSILSNNFNLPDKRINETIDSLVGAILDDGPKK